MNIKGFGTVGYFIRHYFNWSVDYAELEGCAENFLTQEKRETIAAFKREIEMLYTLKDPSLAREVAYKLGDRGMPDGRALEMVALLYEKTWRR